MNIWICRITLLFAFALHWGGLTFYTGFVVRVSHDVLADPMEGGLITQRVTEGIQVLGVLAVSLMTVNSLAVVRRSRAYGIGLGVLTAILAGSLLGLFVVHGDLDSVIDVSAAEITDREAFTIGHRRYNQLTTVQWLASLAYLPVTVFAWRFVDRVSRSGDRDGGATES